VGGKESANESSHMWEEKKALINPPICGRKKEGLMNPPICGRKKK
jgi:hypothetical protein